MSVNPAEHARQQHATPLRWGVLLLVIAALAGALFWQLNPDEERLVVYCAHDSVYSEPILREFSAATGIPVEIVFDTEATKSLGLTERLIAERDDPQCDVFWNNQLLGTLQLEQEGLLEPFKCRRYDDIPTQFKSEEGTWTGFAARLRVFILNSNLVDVHMSEWESILTTTFPSEKRDQFCIAKPLYGTTLSHYSLLWNRDEARLKEWHQESQELGMAVTPGNATVKTAVAQGDRSFGWTDTDDFYVAFDEGLPVEARPILVDGRAIAIPNTVAIIKGTQRMEAARRLVDYLVSADVQLKMANSKSRQIPVGPVDESQLSTEVKQLREWADNAHDLRGTLQARSECLAWLKSIYQ